MKRILAAITVIISCATGHAGMSWTNTITGAVAPQPTYRPANAGGAPSGYFMEPGWQQFSFDQQADHDAKEASVAAAIEAERLKNQLPQPVLEIAIVDSNFTSIGTASLVIDAETGALITTTNEMFGSNARASTGKRFSKAEQKSEFATKKQIRSSLKTQAISSKKETERTDALVDAVFGK